MFLNKPEDIKAILILSDLHEVPVKIKPRGINKIFTSFFCEIFFGEESSPSILIEPLSPEIGNEVLPLSRTVSVEFNALDPANQEAMETYTFYADFIQKEIFEGKPAIRITLPDKRRNLRIAPQQDQPVRILLQSGAAESPGHLINISEGGLSFYSTIRREALGKDALIRAAFVLPGGASLRAEARIRWSSHLKEKKVIEKNTYEHLYGAEFCRLDAHIQEQICSYIFKREEEELHKVMDESLWSVFT